MTTHNLTAQAARAWATGTEQEAVAALVEALDRGLAGEPAGVVIYFAAVRYDAHSVAGPLSRHYPDARVIGCSSAGEFTDLSAGGGGISAMALPQSLVGRCFAALGDLSEDAYTGTTAAAGLIELQVGAGLRELDPASHLGLVLIDGVHGDEETVNEALGDAAPFLNVVGGSAGDDLTFTDTWVAVGGEVSHHGVALLVCEPLVPFRVLKTCSFTPTGRRMIVTSADVANRVVYEFDHRPAPAVYAELVGCGLDDLGSSIFMDRPVGLMVDDQPFIRSPQVLTEDGGLRFYCQILEGMEVELMRSEDLVADTADAFRATVQDLGGTASAALLFNCVLRRLEIEAKQQMPSFLRSFQGVPAVGFHTYGETWIGHMNQTLTAVVFG